MGNAILLMNNGGLLDYIAVTTQPSKQIYSTQSSSTFSTSGMVVTAYYMNGTSKTVSGYTCNNPSYWSTTGPKTVVITYVESGISKSTSITVNVIAATVKYTWEAVTPADPETAIPAYSYLQTANVPIDSNYQNSSKLKIYWEFEQTGSDNSFRVNNDTGNYVASLRTNSSSLNVELGASPFTGAGWADNTYKHGAKAKGTVTTDGATGMTRAALRFNNGTSYKFYGTLSGWIEVTTAL